MNEKCAYFNVCLTRGMCPCNLANEPKDEALYKAAQTVFELSLETRTVYTDVSIARDNIYLALKYERITDAEAIELLNKLYTRCPDCTHADFVPGFNQPVGCKLLNTKFSQDNPQPILCEKFVVYPSTKIESIICEGRR